MIRSKTIASATCALLLLTGATLSAHPYHASRSMVEWNAQTRKLEIALRADPLDVEEVLKRLSKGKITLEAKSADKLLLKYLEDRFLVTQGKAKPGRLTWVGKEVTPKAVWLYFEIPVTNPQQMKFSVRVFQELEKTHAHTLHLKLEKQRQTLRFGIRR